MNSLATRIVLAVAIVAIALGTYAATQAAPAPPAPNITVTKSADSVGVDPVVEPAVAAPDPVAAPAVEGPASAAE